METIYLILGLFFLIYVTYKVLTLDSEDVADNTDQNYRLDKAYSRWMK